MALTDTPGVPGLGKAVFLDKDGTLVENIPFNADPDRMRLLPQVGPALRKLHALGYRLFVVSNQAGVAYDYFPEAALRPVEHRLADLFRESQAALTGFYYCPHHPGGTVPEYAVSCACRKPAPGMLLQAARMHGLDLTRCWMIGDILDDVEAGARAGCTTVLIDNGNETEWLDSPLRRPQYVVHDLHQAASRIEQHTEQRRIRSAAG